MAGPSPQRKPQSRTVGDLCERWFALAELDLSPSVQVTYRRLLDARILPRWGAVPLRELTTADLDVWYSELRRTGSTRGGPLKPNSVMRVHALLRRALGQGVKWGWLPTNPAALATPPRARPPELQLPSADDVGRLIAAAGRVNPLLPVFLRLAATTGARRGELCALRWSHVDTERRRLTIARGIVVGPRRAWIEKDTKTHQVRRVSLDADTLAVLLAHRDRCAAVAAAAGRALAADAYVFSHAVDGSRPIRPDYVSLAFGRLRTQLGLPGVKLHHLRHFSATQLLALGIDVRTVSGRLGHASPATTLDVYAQFVEQADERAADLIGTLLSGDGPSSGHAPARDVGHEGPPVL